MDKSETYIKMRLAAVSDLGMGIPPDLIPQTEVTWMNTFVFVDRLGNFYYSDVEQTCQLERQDQLQEMIEFPIGGINDNFWSVLRDISQWAFDFQHEDFKTYIPLSMGQLWLCFVMKELFKKRWIGDKWIKIVSGS